MKKAHDLDKKNLVRVSLTEKGQKAYEISTKRSSIHSIMGILEDSERTRLRELLGKLQMQARKEIGLDREKYLPLD